MNSAKLSKLSEDLVNAIASCGHPAELGELVAASLGTEKTPDASVRSGPDAYHVSGRNTGRYVHGYRTGRGC